MYFSPTYYGIYENIICMATCFLKRFEVEFNR